MKDREERPEYEKRRHNQRASPDGFRESDDVEKERGKNFKRKEGPSQKGHIEESFEQCLTPQGSFLERFPIREKEGALLLHEKR